MERLGPRRLMGALLALGVSGDGMPNNVITLTKRLFCLKGIPREQITYDYFADWVEEYEFVGPQFVDLKKITSQVVSAYVLFKTM